MAQNIPVVVIDSEADSVNRIVSFIKTLGNHAVVDGVATGFETGFELIHKKRPMVVIMEIGPDIDESIKRIRAILGRFPRTLVFATSYEKSTEAILKVMRAGAAEYILRPVSEEDLVSALQKAGRLWIAKPAPTAEMGRIVTLFSPKGGVGVTTIVTSLSTCIYAATSRPTLLVDLDLDAGDVTTFLNIKTTYTISDVTLNMSRLDESFLKGVISRHESGIYVLAEPKRVEEGVSVPGRDIGKLLRILKGMFSYVVVDTENVMDERTKAAVEVSDTVLVVFVMSLPNIKHIQRHLVYLEGMGIRKERVKLVVNRYMPRGEITIKDAEKVLGYPVSWSIPNDYDSAMASLNKGIPLSAYSPRSKVTLAIKEIADSLVSRLDEEGRDER